MNFSTNHRALALLTGVLIESTTSCQSTKPGFSFQPAPHWQAAVPVPAAQVPVGAPALAAPVAPAPAAAKRSRQRARPRSSPARALLPAPTGVAGSGRQAAGPAAPHQRRLFARPRATAERGLGTTVVGVLGLVALPVAVLGLLLSGGGLVWGIVAGAAALAVLVAYLDPFGH